MRDLVKFGVDVDAAEAKSGRTPLHFAVEKHDVEIIRYLLEVRLFKSDCFKSDRPTDGSRNKTLIRGFPEV